MNDNRYLSLYNNQFVAVNKIPVHSYYDFFKCNLELLKDNQSRHCVNYFGFPVSEKIKLISCIADDQTHQVYVFSSLVDRDEKFASLTAQNNNFEKF